MFGKLIDSETFNIVRRKLISYRYHLTERLIDRGYTNHEKYEEEKALRELGYKYAQEYAEKKIEYIYEDRRIGEHKSHPNRLDVNLYRHLTFLHKQVTYTLDTYGRE